MSFASPPSSSHVEFLDCFVRGNGFLRPGRVDSALEMLNLGVDRFTQQSQQCSPSKTTLLFGVNNHLYLDCARLLDAFEHAYAI